MLSSFEKVLFIFLVLICAVAAVNTFGYMFRIIGRGQGELSRDHAAKRIREGIVSLFSQGEIIRHRRRTSIFHYFVAWGFIFYLLVNAVEVAEGLITGFHFFPDNIIGNLYRLNGRYIWHTRPHWHHILFAASFCFFRQSIGGPGKCSASS